MRLPILRRRWRCKPDYPEAQLGRAAAYHMANQDALARADLAALENLTLDDTLKAALRCTA